MKKILLTGFENFGAYSENISEIAAKNIKRCGSYAVEGLVFPVRIFSTAAINYGVDIVNRAREIDASAIISLGIGSDVYGLRIESVATNWVENTKYCLESEQKRIIVPGPQALEIDLTRWDIEKIISKLKDSGLVYESKISNNANTFCCNALIYRTLLAMQQIGCNIPYLFLHIPCSARGVVNISDFDKSKALISLPQIRKILGIILS